MSKRTGLAAAIRRHSHYDKCLFAHTHGHWLTARTHALRIGKDLRLMGWKVTAGDVIEAVQHSKPQGRPRKPPAEHELQCPHCHKPIIVETAR